jgi:hypothetical protein
VVVVAGARDHVSLTGLVVDDVAVFGRCMDSFSKEETSVTDLDIDREKM